MDNFVLEKRVREESHSGTIRLHYQYAFALVTSFWFFLFISKRYTYAQSES